jgi:two-component system, cell cycle response regulator
MLRRWRNAPQLRRKNRVEARDGCVRVNGNVSESDPKDLFDPDEEDSTAIVKLANVSRATPIPTRDRYVLVRVQGEDIGRVVLLENREFVIGRHQSCDLPLSDNSVSRRHAHILWSEGRYLLEDLGSANGTYVGADRIEQHWLDDGDVIQFGSTIAYRYSVTDSQQLAMLQYLYDASVTDALTGAYNREYFDARLVSELAYARRHEAPLSLLMMDVDHFKQVNDTFGHQVGDEALVKLVESVRTRLRLEDVFCRYGGEEFTAILRTTDLEAAACAAERIRLAIAQIELSSAGRRVPITVSIGCSSVKCCTDWTTEELVAIADRRLYAAKHSGRNRVVSNG